MTEEKKPLFTVLGIAKNEEGHLELDFDLSDEFVEKFKEENDLKRWSQKRFDEWVSQNIELILEATGIAQQLRDLDDEPNEE